MFVVFVLVRQRTAKGRARHRALPGFPSHLDTKLALRTATRYYCGGRLPTLLHVVVGCNACKGLTPRSVAGFYSVMILPQVHLRKPCYDFTFL